MSECIDEKKSTDYKLNNMTKATHAHLTKRHWKQMKADWNEMGCRQRNCRCLKKKEKSDGKEKSRSLLRWVTDTLVLRSVPVHLSSHSPTDELWKQIWGSPALFCRLGDLSESSQTHVSQYVSPANISLAQLHPVGISASPPPLLAPPPTPLPFSSPSHLFIMQMFLLFFFVTPLCLLESLFKSNIFAAYVISECVCVSVCVCDKLQNTESINHCHLAAQCVSVLPENPQTPPNLSSLVLASIKFSKPVQYINICERNTFGVGGEGWGWHG